MNQIQFGITHCFYEYLLVYGKKIGSGKPFLIGESFRIMICIKKIYSVYVLFQQGKPGPMGPSKIPPRGGQRQWLCLGNLNRSDGVLEYWSNGSE